MAGSCDTLAPRKSSVAISRQPPGGAIVSSSGHDLAPAAESRASITLSGAAFANRDLANERSNQDEQHQRNGSVPDPQAAGVPGLPGPIGEGGTQRSREDVGDPKPDDSVQAEEAPRNRRQQEAGGEQEAGREEAGLGGVGRYVSGGGPLRDRRDPGEPVEGLAAR